jgi:hypothetical protein
LRRQTILILLWAFLGFRKPGEVGSCAERGVQNLSHEQMLLAGPPKLSFGKSKAVLIKLKKKNSLKRTKNKECMKKKIGQWHIIC